MLDRWPIEFRNRVHVFDGALTDPMFTKKTDNVKRLRYIHLFLVTMSHVHVANTLFADNETSSYLFLEEDYELVQPKAHSMMSLNSTASNIAQFVEKDESWQFLRLGYYPEAWQTGQAGTKAVQCKAACMCRTVHKGICSITPGGLAEKQVCWIRSTVGYAVHRRAWAALQNLEKCSMDANVDKFGLSIDNWLPGHSERGCRFRSPVHYLVPGVFYQRASSDDSKIRHEKAMARFSSKCAVTNKHSLPTISSTTGHLTEKTRTSEKRAKNRHKIMRMKSTRQNGKD